MDAPFNPEGLRPGRGFNPDRWPDVSRVFAAAVELDTDARSGYLEQACSEDPELRSAVESLLAAHGEAGSFGDTIPFPPLATSKRLAPGTQLGTFRVEMLLGAGGMGEVYRAYDTKLGRAVALKVLPDSFANDADRRGRFEEEARALAALNHPHIGAIYGVHESGDVAALVLELVDGPTLAERLAAGPLPFDEVVRIARQLADGLEAAHERGIVHRDFKPANIKITADGNVKILDFGLAKVEGWSGRDASPEPQSPTVSRRATVAGAVVGTAAYMSPEQARGQAVDKRADIWAFGCVLFEMCARRPPFMGANIGEIRTAVLEREPEWRRLPGGTPPALEQLLRRCLSKDPKGRLRDIGEARIALASESVLAAPSSAARSRTWTTAMIGISSVIALVSVVAAVWFYVRPPRVSEFPVNPPDDTSFSFHESRTFIALAPDGSRLAFVADGGSAGTEDVNRIWIREISRIEATPVKGTEGALALFWSPDSRSLAFLAGGKLKRVDVPAGNPAGTVTTVCDVTEATSTHGTWGTKGVILLGRGHGQAIEAVTVADGTKREVLAPKPANREARVHWPWFLPDGNRFLYTARLEDGEGELRIGQLDGRSRPVMRLASNTQWVEPDIVVFARDGVLMGQHIDLDAAQPIGAPFSIAAKVAYFGTTSRAVFSTSRSGDVAYHPGGNLAQHVWVDPKGLPAGTVGPLADYHSRSGRLSHDDSALLTARIRPGVGTYDIWHHDLVRNTERQLTDGRGTEHSPVWTDGGRGIVFSADVAGIVPQLFHRNLDTRDDTQLLPGSRNQQLSMDVFADGAVAYAHQVPKNPFQLFKLPMNPRGDPILLPAEGSAYSMRLSPDGRTMAFLSRKNGLKVYVASVGASTPVLAAQGIVGEPRWSRDGTEVYYVRDELLMSISVSAASVLTVGTPRPLFAVKRHTVLVDVARDGRFLLLVPHVREEERPVVVKLRAIPSARP